MNNWNQINERSQIFNIYGEVKILARIGFMVERVVCRVNRVGLKKGCHHSMELLSSTHYSAT